MLENNFPSRIHLFVISLIAYQLLNLIFQKLFYKNIFTKTFLQSMTNGLNKFETMKR